MEKEIEETLYSYYTNITINVEFIAFNLYKIEILGLEKQEISFKYKYDNYLTKYCNIVNICESIDRRILSHYHKMSI